MDDDNIASYDFPEDPETYLISQGPDEAQRYPSLYDVFLL